MEQFADPPRRFAELPDYESIEDGKRQVAFNQFAVGKSTSQLFSACRNEHWQWKKHAVAAVKERQKKRPKVARSGQNGLLVKH